MEIDKLLNPTHIAETESIFCCILDNRIFYSYHKPDSQAQPSDFKFILNQYTIHNVNGPLPVLAELGQHATVDKATREFLQQHKAPFICEAIVITSLAQRLLANFYMSVKSHKSPTKVFNSKEKALEWIDTF